MKTMALAILAVAFLLVLNAAMDNAEARQMEGQVKRESGRNLDLHRVAAEARRVVDTGWRLK